jgi:hypothetical protein
MMDELLALVREKQKEKERQKERDKEREVEKEKEKEKEEDMEAALYVNCLLLGLDPSILASGGGGVISNGSRLRAGLFRHPNPRVGEALLHFLLCALRGPYLSSKDFAGVWPIFDAAQSRDFRKVKQSSSSHGLAAFFTYSYSLAVLNAIGTSSSPSPSSYCFWTAVCF